MRSIASPAPGRRRWWQRWYVEVAIVVAIVVGIQAWQGRDTPRGPAPDFRAPAAAGGEVGLADWRAAHPGRTVGIYFWAGWCPICRAQESAVDALRADWPIMTVAMQSGGAGAVAATLRERGLDWTTAVDADGRIAAMYGLHGVPAFVVVDEAGAIRSIAIGYTTAIGMRLRLWWATTGA